MGAVAAFQDLLPLPGVIVTVAASPPDGEGFGLARTCLVNEREFKTQLSLIALTFTTRVPGTEQFKP